VSVERIARRRSSHLHDYNNSAPPQPAGIKRGNWIQTDPKKGWFAILRLYSPLEAKTWRPSEIALVR